MNFKNLSTKAQNWKSKAALTVGLLTVAFNSVAQCAKMRAPEFSVTGGLEYNALMFSNLSYETQPLRAVVGAQLELKSDVLTPIFSVQGSVPVAGGKDGGYYTTQSLNGTSETSRYLNYSGQEKYSVDASAYLGIGGNLGYRTNPLSAGLVGGLRTTVTDLSTSVYPYIGAQMMCKVGDKLQVTAFMTYGSAGIAEIKGSTFTGQFDPQTQQPIYKETVGKENTTGFLGVRAVYKFSI